MYQAQLFFGYPVQGLFSDLFHQIPKNKLALFVRDGDAYLQQLDVDGVTYLGKYINGVISVDELEMMRKNLYSHLNRMVSGYPFEETQLMLHPVFHPPDSWKT